MQSYPHLCEHVKRTAKRRSIENRLRRALRWANNKPPHIYILPCKKGNVVVCPICYKKTPSETYTNCLKIICLYFTIKKAVHFEMALVDNYFTIAFRTEKNPRHQTRVLLFVGLR